MSKSNDGQKSEEILELEDISEDFKKHFHMPEIHMVDI